MRTTRFKKRNSITSKEISDSFDDFLIEGIFKSSRAGLVYANPAFLKMFGYNSVEEVLGLRETDFFADEEASAHLMDWGNTHGLITNQRVLLKKKSKKTFWGLLTCKKSHHNGNIFFEGRILDISSQIQIEKQLAEKKYEIEKLSMELDRFIYSTSHDMRSPVTTILGIINLMKLDLKDEQTKIYIQMMEVSMEKLDHFIKELVEHARNSKTVVEDTSIEFKSLIQNILKEMEHHTAFSTLTINFEFDHLYRFYSDPERMRLILRNIIKNAFDYYDVAKITHLLSITVKSRPEKVLIEIFDNGIGITAKQVNHVFEMFYRGTLQSKGPGMGLYTAREAVIKLAGVITLESEFGVGTSVKIELPNSIKGRLINKKNGMKTKLGSKNE